MINTKTVDSIVSILTRPMNDLDVDLRWYHVEKNAECGTCGWCDQKHIGRKNPQAKNKKTPGHNSYFD